MKAKLVGKHLGYPAAAEPGNVVTDFFVKLGYWPMHIVYPANHPPQLTTEERKKLRQDFGVTVRTSGQNSPLALAGPIRHVE